VTDDEEDEATPEPVEPVDPFRAGYEMQPIWMYCRYVRYT
jgi:hypothetical protein